LVGLGVDPSLFSISSMLMSLAVLLTKDRAKSTKSIDLEEEDEFCSAATAAFSSACSFIMYLMVLMAFPDSPCSVGSSFSKQALKILPMSVEGFEYEDANQHKITFCIDVHSFDGLRFIAA